MRCLSINSFLQVSSMYELTVCVCGCACLCARLWRPEVSQLPSVMLQVCLVFFESGSLTVCSIVWLGWPWGSAFLHPPSAEGRRGELQMCMVEVELAGDLSSGRSARQASTFLAEAPP